MLLHKTYKTIEEKDAIIEDMLTLGLTEVSTVGLFVGKHLLFTDNIPDAIPHRDYGKEIDAIKADIKELKTPK